MKPHAVEVQPSGVSGSVQAVPSKSVTHRAFLLAAQSSEPSTVRNPLLSDDTRAMLSALVALGARAHLDPDHPDVVHFLPSAFRPPSAALDCRNAGTALRLLTATAARLPVPGTLTGDASLRSRPNAALLDALRSLGATCTSHEGQAPITVKGPLRPGPVRLDATGSSQFVSALLLSLPFLPGPSLLQFTAAPASHPYLAVTRQVAAAFGVPLHEHSNGWSIPGQAQPRCPTYTVEGDWSAAAFPLTAAAITGSNVAVRGLDPTSAQGDRAVLPHLAAFGATVHATRDEVQVTGGNLHSPGAIDVGATPDLFPVLAVVAAYARGTTTFTGGASLRNKESDRIAAMADGLQRMGIAAKETPDGLVVVGGRPQGATLTSRDDHRIHMALAVAALGATGPSRIDGAATAAVSYPGFHNDLESLGAKVRTLHGNTAVAP